MTFGRRERGPPRSRVDGLAALKGERKYGSRTQGQCLSEDRSAVVLLLCICCAS